MSEEYPDDRTVSYILGAALLKVNRTKDAKVLLERMSREAPSAESEYLLGQSEYLSQNLIPAATHLARAVELDPKLPGVHSFYGQVLRSAGKLDDAAEQFRQELEVNAYDFLANTEVAMQLKQDGKLDEALVRMERALQVRPDDAGALYQRASIHMMQGHIERARAELEDVTRRYPEFSEAHAGLATVYYRLKRTADGDRERAAARGTQR
jgi:tetratricopeptide (TPR) repeat protein